MIRRLPSNQISDERIDCTAAVLANAVREYKAKVPELYRFRLHEQLDPLRDAIGDKDWIRTLRSRGARSKATSRSPTYDDTLTLREKLAEILQDDPDVRAKAAEWIIRVWGGVDRGGTAKIDDIVRKAEAWSDTSEQFDGRDGYQRVAQWSKYLAFRHPTRAAICDSRVIYAINWYLRAATPETAVLFPPLVSENRLVSLLDHTIPILVARLGAEQVLKRLDENIDGISNGMFDKSRLHALQKDAGFISEQYAYRQYCRVLNHVADDLYPNDVWALTKAEMLLYTLSTTEVARGVARVVVRTDPGQAVRLGPKDPR